MRSRRLLRLEVQVLRSLSVFTEPAHEENEEVSEQRVEQNASDRVNLRQPAHYFFHLNLTNQEALK